MEAQALGILLLFFVAAVSLGEQCAALFRKTEETCD